MQVSGVLVLLMFIFANIAICFSTEKGEWDTEEARIIAKILKEYNKDERPMGEDSNITTIHMAMTLSQVIAVNEKSEEMATSIYMIHVWNDTRLQWNEDDYGGVNITRIPADDLWVPRIILQNSKDDKFDVSLRTEVLVRPSGRMEWMPPSLYKSSCEINVELFPFDWQNCTMVFRSLSYSSEELILTTDKDITIDKKAYQKNGEWDLLSIPGKASITYLAGTPYADVTFYFILKRRPQFYVMNLFVPCILMMTFSCFTFFLPTVSGEKMTLSVSTLLGETVFLFLIAQKMPETSRSVPFIGLYLIFSMSLIIVCVVFNVLVCNIHYRSSTTHRMPNWVRKYVMVDLAKWLRVKRPEPSSPWQIAMELRKQRLKELLLKATQNDHATWKSPSESLFDNQAKRYGFKARHRQNSEGFTEVLSAPSGRIEASEIPTVFLPLQVKYRPAVDSVKFISKNVTDKERREQSSDDWAFCAMVLDRLFFWIYTSSFLLGTIGFFLRVLTAYYPEKDPFLEE